MDDKTIESEIFKAIGYLFIALIAYVVYQMGKKGLGRTHTNFIGQAETTYNLNESRRQVLIRLFQGLGTIVLIALAAAYMFLGTSSDCSDADPLYGGCTTTVEREPSSQERVSTTAYYLTLLGLPFLTGVSEAYANAKRREHNDKLAEQYKDK